MTIAEFSPVALSKFERGINSPSFANLIAICHALDVSPNYLSGWHTETSDADSSQKQLKLNQLQVLANGLSDEWVDQLISIAETAGKEE